MSEKVLGFRKKDALYDNGGALVQGWAIDESKLVPVVSLEALKTKCNGLSFEAGAKEYSQDYLLALAHIEDWAKKEAGK